MSELQPPVTSTSSDSDQFARDTLSASDGLNIVQGGASPDAQGLQGSLDAYQGIGAENSKNNLQFELMERRPKVGVAEEYRGHDQEQVAQAPTNSREPDVLITRKKSSMSKAPSGAAIRHRTASAHCQVELSARDVGAQDHPMSSLGDSETIGVVRAREHDSATENAPIHQDTVDMACGGLHLRSHSAESSRNGDTRASASQRGLPGLTTTVESDNRDTVNAVSNKGALQVAVATDTTKETESVDLHNSSLRSPVEPDIEISSTPPMTRNEPTLASPLRLEADANVFQSTPPSSPMKLSSPPSVKPLKKVNRIHNGLGAPFRNPIRCALPTSSPLPPSSPPAMFSSPPPAKKRHRVDSDSEDPPTVPPVKVRRTAHRQTPSAPFVSPLRSGAGSSSRSKLPGGFSTPLRASKTRHFNFSSPILPSQPDVFTTPATAARSSPAYRRPAATRSSPSSESVFVVNATPTSSSYALRPPRAVTRPFKPPAKSTRPTAATLQALRQRVQLLRNALRIRGLPDPTLPAAEASHSAKAADDDELEALAKQWRSSAREAAQDLWGLVRDTMGEDSWGSGNSSGKQDSWGWFTKPQPQPRTQVSLDYAGAEDPGLDDTKNLSTFTPPPTDKVHHGMVKSLSRPVVPRKTMLPPHEDAYEHPPTEEEAEDAEPKENGPKYHTLGTMLTSLGIPHEVLGWNEEEGEFVD